MEEEGKKRLCVVQSTKQLKRRSLELLFNSKETVSFVLNSVMDATALRGMKEEYDKLRARLENYEKSFKENYFKHRDRIKRMMEKMFDLDGDGQIDWIEFKALTENLGEQISEEEAKSMLWELDKDKNGKIDMNEFWDWWRSPLGEFTGSRLQLLNAKLRARELPAEADIVAPPSTVLLPSTKLRREP